MKGASVFILKLLLILIFAGWVSLWLLKPTEFWTRKWKEAEEKATSSILGYNGLDFVVYTFPIIAVAVIGFIYLELKQREQRKRKRRSILTSFTSAIVVNKNIGILSGIQIVSSLLFILFLIWTFYAHISNDFKKTTPDKSLKLHQWQHKAHKMATRCGLLAEACLALLLLPVMRGMSIFRFIGVQFEASVRYHIWLGTTMLLFATLHGVGTLFVWGMKYKIQDEMLKWQQKGRIYLAGEIAFVAGVVIWITSLPQIRRKWFEVFYYTHHLYIVFLVFFLFHAGDRHFYMVFPGVFLFAVDKLLRIIQSRAETCILSARILPCRAIELTLPKDSRLKYTPTSVIFLKIPSISKFQWHPFSLTSSSSIDEQTMSVIVKSEGQWTSSLYNKILDEQDAEANQKQCIPIAIEGPYGPATLHFLGYDNLILVAGGIGITPFLSILQEIGSSLGHAGNRYPDRIQFIYIVKTSEEICLLNPILPHILDTEHFHIKLKIFVTRENQIGLTLREVFNDIPETHIRHFNTSGLTYVTYGSENLLWMAAITLVCSFMFLLALACFNHFIVSPSGQKFSSSVIDLHLMCSFAIALISTTLIAAMIRRKRMKEDLQILSDKQSKALKQNSLEARRELKDHEIHFGERPNFQGIFSNFTRESEGSDIGVLVCGPETMKESVASACRLSSMVSQTGTEDKKPHLIFHSLNFTL